MKVTLKQLQVFMQTARLHSLTRAAEACFITQSAASMALAQLETILDKHLFDRVGKRLQLNADGKKLLPKAIAILEHAHAFENAFVSHSEEPQGKLYLGASTTIANYVLPQVLSDFRKKYPLIEFDVMIGNTQEVMHALCDFTVDMGFVEGFCKHPDLTATVCLRDELQVICRANHPLAKKTIVNQKDLGQYSWVVREEGSGTRAVFDRFIGLDDEVNIEMVLGSSEAIKCYVVNSDSLGCLSKYVLQCDPGNQRYRALSVKGVNIKRNLYQLKQKDRESTELCQLFNDYIASASSSLASRERSR